MATKWGIASAGRISNDFVAAVRSMNSDEHQFVAIAARDKAAAQRFASIHNIPTAYGSYDELAKDPNVEVVYVGSISSQHFPLGKLMLENNKHVLMEKPMTLNLKQTKALIEIAKKRKRFLMEALWSRFLPSYKFLMNHIKNGTIGKVVHVDANLGLPIMERERIAKRSIDRAIITGLGIYPLNVVSMVYDGEKPTKIASVGHLNEDGIGASMTSSLLYRDNRTACVSVNGLASLPCDMVITGTKGLIKVPNAMYCALTIHTPEKTYNFPLPDPDVSTNYPNTSGLKYEAIEVRECIRNGALESSIMPLKDSEMLAEVMDEIRHQIGVVYPED